MPDHPGATLIFWIFFSTGIIMLSSYVSWNMHDKRNAKRQAEMRARQVEEDAKQEQEHPYEPFKFPSAPKNDDEIEEWEI